MMSSNNELEKFLSLIPVNPKTIQKIAFSTSVQHGPGMHGMKAGAIGMFERAGYGKVSNEQFIDHLYKERGSILSGTSRFESEKKSALEMLMAEQNQLLTKLVNNAEADAATRAQMHKDINRKNAAYDPVAMLNQKMLATGTL